MLPTWLRKWLRSPSRRKLNTSPRSVRPLVEGLEGRCLPAQVFWAIDADGAWNNPTNWSPARVPGTSDEAILDRPSGAYVVTVSGGTHYPGDITATRSQLRFTGGAMWPRGDLNLGGGLIMEGGQIGLQYNLVTGGSSRWTDGTIDGYGGRWTNNGTVTLDGATHKQLHGGSSLSVTNNGTWIHNGTGNLQVTSFTVFTNTPDGLYELRTDAGIVGLGAFTGSFLNQGVLRKAEGEDVSAVSALANRGGTLEVLTGTLRLGGASKNHTDGGSFIIATGAVLDPTSSSNNGSFSGRFTGSGGGVLDLSDGTLGVGTLGATFDLPAGMFQWTGGALDGPLTNTGVLTLSGPATKRLSGILNNSGLLLHGGTGPLQLAARLNNLEAGIYDLQTDAGLLGSSAFDNVGYFHKSGGSGASTVEPPFTNNGILGIDIGTLAFTRTVTQQTGLTYMLGTTLTITGTGMLDVRAGAVFGFGVINGNVRNAGLLDIGWTGNAGFLVVNGNYTQTATGILNVEIGKVLDALVSDYLYVSGTATLAGTLNVVHATETPLAPDDFFRVFDFGARAGDFTTVGLPDVGKGRVLYPYYDAYGLTLWVFAV